MRRNLKKPHTSTDKIFLPPSSRPSLLPAAQLLTFNTPPAPGHEQICKLSNLTCLFVQIQTEELSRLLAPSSHPHHSPTAVWKVSPL